MIREIILSLILRVAIGVLAYMASKGINGHDQLTQIELKLKKIFEWKNN